MGSHCLAADVYSELGLKDSGDLGVVYRIRVLGFQLFQSSYELLGSSR
jgi:hypothetical protein